jgi:hypothetical protein
MPSLLLFVSRLARFARVSRATNESLSARRQPLDVRRNSRDPRPQRTVLILNPENVLGSIAGVAATFVGFTGVIFAVGRFSRGDWTIAERNALGNLLMPSLVALFMALFPLAILASVEGNPTLWRVANGGLAAIHLPLVSSALWRAIRSELAEPLPLRFVLIPGGFISVALSGLAAFGALNPISAAIFAGGLVWFLVVAATQFVILIMPKLPPKA